MFVRLLQGTFRLRSCHWINIQQRQSIEHCIKALVDIAKGRGIAIPADLENQVTGMFGKNALISKQSRAWLTAARTGIANVKQRPTFLDISTRINTLAQSASSASGSPLTTPLIPAVKSDRTIIEGLHDIVQQLEQQLKPLVQAELSVLVDILYRPENLFHPNTEARNKCSNGGFICKLINHTEKLLEEKEDKLCGKVLETLKEMMAVDPDYDEKVRMIENHLYSCRLN